MSSINGSTDPRIIKSELFVDKYPYNSLNELLVDRLTTDPDNGCLIDCSLDRKWTKSQVLDSSLNFAFYLINECQLKKGEIVCFIANDSDIHAMALIGVLFAGGVYGSIPGQSVEYEIRDVIGNLKPTVLVCCEDNYQLINNIVKEQTFIKKLLVLESKSDLLSIETILSQKRTDIPLPILSDPDHCLCLSMSSGSTGHPKAIMLTNRNIMADVRAQQHNELAHLTSQDIVLSSAFCHILGQVFLFSCINSGAQLAIVRDVDTYDQIYININKYEITSAMIIPTKLNFLAKNSDKYNKYYLKSLRTVWTTGLPLSQAIYESIVDKYDFEKFINGFGMSEIYFALMVFNSDSKRMTSKGTVGKLVPGFECKVIDKEGNSLGPNEHGQLCFKGDQVTPGYLNNSTENDKLFTSDGFLKSGDFGYYDEKHFFYISGRIKDILNIEGDALSPAELENVLIQNKNIENAAVIGINDEEFGEIPLAFVTLVKGANVSGKEIQEWADSRLSHLKKLRGGVRVIDKFPLTSLNKIKKNVLKQMVDKYNTSDVKQ